MDFEIICDEKFPAMPRVLGQPCYVHILVVDKDETSWPVSIELGMGWTEEDFENILAGAYIATVGTVDKIKEVHLKKCNLKGSVFN